MKNYSFIELNESDVLMIINHNSLGYVFNSKGQNKRNVKLSWYKKNIRILNYEKIVDAND